MTVTTPKDTKLMLLYALSAATMVAAGFQLANPVTAKANPCCIDDWDCGDPLTYYCDTDFVSWACQPITYDCVMY